MKILSCSSESDVLAMNDPLEPPTEDQMFIAAAATEMMLSPFDYMDGWRPYSVVGNTAIVNISGMMVGSCDMWREYYGYCSMELLKWKLDVARSDPGVKNVIVQIDSGGGHVLGIHEAGESVKKLRDAGKGIFSFSSSIVGSAAYQFASYCDGIFLSSRTVQTLSIGTVFVVADSSKMMKEMGVNVLKFASGDLKQIGTPGVPITAAQKEHLMATVMQYANDFVGTVVENRPQVGSLVVGEGYADGRVVLAQEALDNGFIDGILSLETLLEVLGEASDETLNSMSKITGEKPLDKLKALLGGNKPAATPANVSADAETTSQAEKDRDAAEEKFANLLAVAAKHGAAEINRAHGVGTVTAETLAKALADDPDTALSLIIQASQKWDSDADPAPGTAKREESATEKTPEEVRRERVEARVKAQFGEGDK
jgi:protease-4